MAETPLMLFLLFLAGLAAGLVDSIAGGGGLITIPAMLAVGMPPHIALGTNKFQASFGSFTATYYYARHHVVDLRSGLFGSGMTLIGAALGTMTVQQIDNHMLAELIPWLLLAILIYALLTPAIGEKEAKPRMAPIPFFLLFGILLGFYDGFFGPGVGSFWALAFILGLGFDLVKSTGYTKLMNFTSNIVALLLFLIAGSVWFLSGSVMAIGQILGSRLGAKLVIRQGARLVRPIFLVMVLTLMLKLFYDQLRYVH